MTLVVDGVEIQTLYVDGVQIQNAYVDGNLVYNNVRGEAYLDDFNRSANGTLITAHAMNTGNMWRKGRSWRRHSMTFGVQGRSPCRGLRGVP